MTTLRLLPRRDEMPQRHPSIEAAYDLALVLTSAIKTQTPLQFESASTSLNRVYGLLVEVGILLASDAESGGIPAALIVCLDECSGTFIYLSALSKMEWQGRATWHESAPQWWDERAEVSAFARQLSSTLLELSEQPWSNVDRERIDELLHFLITMSGLFIMAPEKSSWAR